MSNDSRVAPLELKAVDAQTRTIEGYCSTFGGPPDVVGDVVVAGAFDRSIRERKLTEIGVYVNHRTDRLPIGVPLAIAPDHYGLRTATRIFRTQPGDDLLNTAKELLAMGAELGMSIGYKTRGHEWRRTPEGEPYRALTDVDLREYSFVPAHLAANRRALVSAVKQVQPMTMEEMRAELAEVDAWLLEYDRRKWEDGRAQVARYQYELNQLDDRPLEVKREEDARRKVQRLWELVDTHGMEHYDELRRIAGL